MPRVFLSDKLDPAAVQILQQAGLEVDNRQRLTGAALKDVREIASGEAVGKVAADDALDVDELVAFCIAAVVDAVGAHRRRADIRNAPYAPAPWERSSARRDRDAARSG